MQVPTPIVEGDGAFSFHIPLPNPKGPIRAFLDRVREVLSSPLPPHYAPHLNALMPGALQCQHGAHLASMSAANLHVLHTVEQAICVRRFSALRVTALPQILSNALPGHALVHLQRGFPVGRFLARWMRQNRPQVPQPSGRSSPLSMQLRGRRFCCAGSAATPPGQPPEEKSVLQALQDLGSHFGREGSFGAAPAAAAAPTADGGSEAEPPRPRIGKVQILTATWLEVRLRYGKNLAVQSSSAASA